MISKRWLFSHQVADDSLVDAAHRCAVNQLITVEAESRNPAWGRIIFKVYDSMTTNH